MRYTRTLTISAASLAFVVGATWLLASFDRPLTDGHGFRQTQTAITVFWMLHGGNWWDYPTPVFGTPWSVPFEFPLYQWLVAILVKATGLPIDGAGRLVSFGWLLAGIPPATALLGRHGLPKPFGPAYAALLLASPLYLQWGRAFLIETQAVALCLWQLALFERWLRDRRRRWLLLAVLTGIAGALTKITTVLPFLMLAALIALPMLRSPPQALRVVAGGAFVYGLALLLAILWTRHADAVKAANPIAIWLQSGKPGMIAWNFGSWDQRWRGAMIGAILYTQGEVLGLFGSFALTGICIVLLLKRAEWRSPPWIATAACTGAFLLPFFVFTNLHVQHTYYHAGNGCFLVAAVVLALGQVELMGTSLLLLVLPIMMASQYVGFADSTPSRDGPDDARFHRLGLTLRSLTPPGSAIVVYGADWFPIIAYYAERRAVMESTIPALEDVRRRAAAPATLLGGVPLGAIVRCPSRLDDDAPFAKALARSTATMRRMTAEGCAIYLPAVPPLAAA